MAWTGLWDRMRSALGRWTPWSGRRVQAPRHRRRVAPGPLPGDRRRIRRVGYLDPRHFVSALIGFGRRESDERLHIFSLADFRDAAGDKWERLGDLVGTAVDQIIRRHIDPATDFYTRLDAETACLVIPRAPRPEARARVAAIARDISAHLFGTAAVAGRRPQVTAVNVDLGSVVHPDGALRVEAIQEAVEAAAPVAGPPGRGLGAVHRTTLAKLMDDGTGAHPAPFAISGADGRAAAEPRWVTLTPERRHFDGELPVFEPGSAARGPVDAAAWLDDALDRQASSVAAGRAHLAPGSSLAMLWTPTWVTSLGGLGAYHARLVRQDDDGEPVLEGCQAYAGAGPVETLTLDRFVSGQVARELRAIVAGRHRVGLTVPFHWMSLAPRWRDCIRAPFEDIPVHARRRLLKIEIFGVTAAVPPAILRDLFAPLAALDCDILVRLPLAAPEIVASLGGVRAIGADLAELPEDERVGDDALFARLSHFRAVAHDAGVACYVWGIRRRQLIERVVTAGFSLVNGPGVTCDVSHPAPLDRE